MWSVEKESSKMMKFMLVWLLFAFNIALGTKELAKGWNDAINWVTLEDGLAIAKENDKPLMIIIHKTWCGACKALKPQFATNKEIEDLSSHFVMVNAEDDDEPSDKQFNQDGGYIPRIFFLSPDGKVDDTLYNENGSQSYKFYYPNPSHIVSTMQKALKTYGKVSEYNRNEL